MGALVIVLTVIALSLVVTRVATIMLSATGMSRESARFQARSALTGVGFTTSEAESVVTHPIRRRVVLTLMLLGSAGLVAAVASLIVSFGGASGDERLTRAVVLLAAVFVLVAVSRSDWVDRRMIRLTTRLMRATGLDVRDYAGLLHISGGYTVGELEVEQDDWVAGQRLGELRLRDEGIVVLGIQRADGGYVGVPGKETRVDAGDTLILYGHKDRLSELDERSRGREGEDAHAVASALPEHDG